ncbi:MAG: hypothetical protein ACE5H0_05565 [Bacteroidota bacterium]
MKNTATVLRTLVLLGIVSFILTESAVACPYCFGTGAEDSAITDGMKMAIASLVGVTGTVLAAFAFFFFRLMRRSERALDSSEKSRTRE